jgi:hypothetical protein
MAESQKSLQEIAYLLATTILNADQNERHTRENILSIYTDCYNTVYDGKVTITPKRAAA